MMDFTRADNFIRTVFFSAKKKILIADNVVKKLGIFDQKRPIYQGLSLGI